LCLLINYEDDVVKYITKFKIDRALIKTLNLFSYTIHYYHKLTLTKLNVPKI
jgi:hypothetical protein